MSMREAHVQFLSERIAKSCLGNFLTRPLTGVHSEYHLRPGPGSKWAGYLGPTSAPSYPARFYVASET
jgi:hypothetical protein